MAAVAPARCGERLEVAGQELRALGHVQPQRQRQGRQAGRASRLHDRWPPNAAMQTLAASGSTATFHSVVGAVLPGDR